MGRGSAAPCGMGRWNEVPAARLHPAGASATADNAGFHRSWREPAAKPGSGATGEMGSGRSSHEYLQPQPGWSRHPHPGAVQACGVGLTMARCPCEIPRSLRRRGETETEGKSVFPRSKAENTPCANKPGGLRWGGLGLSASMWGMQLRTDTTHSSDEHLSHLQHCLQLLGQAWS